MRYVQISLLVIITSLRAHCQQDLDQGNGAEQRDFIVVEIASDTRAEKKLNKLKEKLTKTKAIEISVSDTAKSAIYVFVKDDQDSKDGKRLDKLENKVSNWDSAEVVPVINVTAEGAEIVRNEFILRFRPEISDEVRDRILNEKRIEIKELNASDKDEFLISFKDMTAKEALEYSINYDSTVIEYIEPNFVNLKQASVGNETVTIPKFEFPLVPDDEFINEQWYFSALELFAMDTTDTACWDIAKGDSIVIAVLDDGVDTFHEDLREKIVKPYDYFHESYRQPQPSERHGTACAGILAATSGNSVGIAGVACNALIMPIRICVTRSANFVDTRPWIISKAIRMAVDSGAHIINCSWEVGFQNNNIKTIDYAIDYAIAKNRIVVLAAGNNGSNYLSYPAATGTHKDVITVGALDTNQRLKMPDSLSMWGSQYGDALTVCAPGVGIYTTMPSTFENPKYGIFHGTSFAAPMVSGAIALMLSANRSLTPSQVKNMIMEKSDDVTDDLRLSDFTYKKLNILRIVKAAENAKEVRAVTSSE